MIPVLVQNTQNLRFILTPTLCSSAVTTFKDLLQEKCVLHYQHCDWWLSVCSECSA